MTGEGGAEGRARHAPYDHEAAKMEAWLDEHQDFAQDYFIRKATRVMVDSWLVTHASGGGVVGVDGGGSRPSSGAATPVRKISAHEFERGGLLKPLVTTLGDGTPTFLSVPSPDAPHHHRRSRNDLRHLDERELIFELVKDICNELDVRSLCHKILQNVSTLLHADRGSLFLVQGERPPPPPPDIRPVGCIHSEPPPTIENNSSTCHSSICLSEDGSSVGAPRKL